MTEDKPGLTRESKERLADALAWADAEAHEYAAQAAIAGRRRTLSIQITVDERGQIGPRAVRITGDHLLPAEKSRLTQRLGRER